MSAEFLLNHRRNGGGAVLARSIWVSSALYLLGICAKNLLASGRHFLDMGELRQELGQTIPWFGAVFAFAYTAFYARFASQWSYLASLHNQIKAAQCRPDADPRALAEWKAIFVEGCEELHLSGKPLFASVILAWGSEATVIDAYLATPTGNRERLDKIMTHAERAWPRNTARDVPSEGLTQ
jgi:hypothetical protein